MSNPVQVFWTGLAPAARIGALGGATLALAALAWALFLAVRQDYSVLFAGLSAADAAAVVAKLEQAKVPYRLSDDGAAILVAAEQVYDLRLELMAGDLPLRGGVGFEIFDKQGLGASEQSQRVSYQRALQGELARTIGTLENVRQVRVHLVMPESTLFTRDRQQASAAVAVAMQPGTSLQNQQIVGVQRLVAAAVPGLAPERVVVTDQRGVTVSSADAGGIGTGAADARLKVKREIEDYLTLKVARLLDSAFGPGQAIVSVDATLNFDATKTTIQDLLPGGQGGAEGRVVRRRQITGAAGAEPTWTSAADSSVAPRSPSSSLDVEFEYGRRIDEIIGAPGALTRLSIGVVVPDAVSEQHREKVAELVKMAAGVDERRGDAITVQPLSLIDLAPEADIARDPAPARIATVADMPSRVPTSSDSGWVLGGLVVFIVVVLGLLALPRAPRTRPLTEQERQGILEDIQRALADEPAPTRGPAR